jgi:excisionase family DNA binding protein
VKSTEIRNLDALLDVPKAAEVYGCSEWLIRQRIKRGELSALSLGRLVRIPLSAVLAELGLKPP